MKVGIDTNVLVYFLDKDSQFYEEARGNLLELVRHNLAVLTQQNLMELTSVLTKRGIGVKETLGYVQNFAESIPIVKPRTETLRIFYNLLQAKPVTGARIFDLYLSATFISNGVHKIYTYNEKDFVDIEQIVVWKPETV